MYYVQYEYENCILYCTVAHATLQHELMNSRRAAVRCMNTRRCLDDSDPLSRAVPACWSGASRGHAAYSYCSQRTRMLQHARAAQHHPPTPSIYPDKRTVLVREPPDSTPQGRNPSPPPPPPPPTKGSPRPTGAATAARIYVYSYATEV